MNKYFDKNLNWQSESVEQFDDRKCADEQK